jgi:type I restriction enzyme M protein
LSRYPANSFTRPKSLPACGSLHGTSGVSPLPLGEGRGEGAAVYRDIPGFCRSATLEEIRQKGYVLTPGRYVGAPEQQEQDEPFEAKTSRLFVRLEEQQPKAAKLVAALIANLKELGYGH